MNSNDRKKSDCIKISWLFIDWQLKKKTQEDFNFKLFSNPFTMTKNGRVE